MGFISFNEKYYKKKLEIFENKILTKEDIYEIRQILKVLDDLTDEGYTNLNYQMETHFSCLTRLRALLSSVGEKPFALDHARLPKTSYSSSLYALYPLLDSLMSDARKHDSISENPFLKDITGFCKWIGYEEDTAYIFLLRDTLLPYVYYKNRGCRNLYPWLISRRFLEDITQVAYVDDDIRLPIYTALEDEHIAYDDFKEACRMEMLTVLDTYPRLKQLLSKLLESIPEKKIVIVESGYGGTFPLMLSMLDERISFKMYTTAPFLYETYKDIVYCKRYEDIRKFETLYSQDLLMQYASYIDGQFYVHMSSDTSILDKALAEIQYLMKNEESL